MVLVGFAIVYLVGVVAVLSIGLRGGSGDADGIAGDLLVIGGALMWPIVLIWMVLDAWATGHGGRP